MPKINSSYVKICESSRPRLAKKFSIVNHAVVFTAQLLGKWNLFRDFQQVQIYYSIAHKKQKRITAGTQWATRKIQNDRRLGTVGIFTYHKNNLGRILNTTATSSEIDANHGENDRS